MADTLSSDVYLHMFFIHIFSLYFTPLLCWPYLSTLHWPRNAAKHSIFLGVDAEGAPYFAHDIRDADVADAAAPRASEMMSQGSNGSRSDSRVAGGAEAAGAIEWKSARALELPAPEAALAATAVGVAQV